MRQHINKEQWNELSSEERKPLFDFLDAYALKHNLRITDACTIGQMIEFLGEDVNKANIIIYKNDDVKLDWKNLCNLLWEAVKNKLI